MGSTDVMKVRLSAEGIQEVMSAFKKIEGGAKSVKKSSEGIGSGLRREFQDLGVAVALQQMARFVKGNIEAQAAIQDTVEVTGASAEAISTLGIAAKKEGVSMEALGKGIKALTKFMGNLQEGSAESAKVLNELGLSADDLVGKSLDQQLVTLANAFDTFSDEGQSGMNKTALALKLFGKSGEDLRQVMQRLGGEGFQKLQEEGQKTGQILSGEAALAAKKAKEEMANLEGQVTGLTNAFSQGLIPALGDAVNGLTDTSGTAGSLDGFKKLGEGVGAVAKGIVSAFLIVGHTVAYILNEDITWARALLEDLTKVGKAFVALSRGQYREALKQATGGSSLKNAASGMGTRWDAYTGLQEEALRKVWDKASETAASSTGTKGGKGTKVLGISGKSGTDKTAKAAAAEALASIKRIQDAQKQVLEEGQALNEHSYSAGLTTLEEYLQQRKQLIEWGGQIELQALQEQLNAEVALGKDASQTKINDLRADIDRRARANAQALKEESWKADEDRKKAEEDARRKQDEALSKSAGTANTRLSNALTGTDQAQGAGMLGNDAATAQRIQAYREWLGVMQQLQTTMAQVAQGSGDASLVAEAEALQVQIDGVKISVGQLENEWLNVQAAGANALASGMLDTLMQVGNGTDEVADAFGNMARSIVQSLQQVLAKMMLMKAAEAMFGGAAAGGSTWAQALVGAFGGSYAAGGEIRGPGTGTSDSILARLSDGEFVNRAAAVSYYGPGIFHALNGLHIPKASLPRYADGGMVGGAQPMSVKSDVSGTLGIELSDGLILKVLKSPEAVRIMAANTASNPKRFNRALGNR